jgi:N-acetylglucosaminyl-diphospho-decaprenol L-rhamnosyltransferase
MAPNSLMLTGPSLDVVVVSWNAGALLHECLASVAIAAQSLDVPLSVIVVDNASTDGSLSEIERLGLPLRVVQNPQNRGFAYACNQGARVSRGEFVLFLNPDTRLAGSSLSAPLEFLRDPGNARVGILGVQMVDDAGNVSRSCCHFPTPGRFLAVTTGLNQLLPSVFPGIAMVEWDHAANRSVDHVTGAFFLVRRQAFEELGGFDQRFFVYLEDVDFNKRARSTGWEVFFYADVQVYHEGGGSSKRVLAKRLFYSLDSRIKYSWKHFPPLSAATVTASTLALEPLVRVAYALVKGSGGELRETLEGYRLLWQETVRRFLRRGSWV